MTHSHMCLVIPTSLDEELKEKRQIRYYYLKLITRHNVFSDFATKSLNVKRNDKKCDGIKNSVDVRR